jgi:hypothetical protein
MYITGTRSDYPSRLHELPGLNAPTGTDIIASGLSDISSFLIEGRAYINSGLASAPISGKWEQEVRRWRWTLSGDASQMLTQQF